MITQVEVTVGADLGDKDPVARIYWLQHTPYKGEVLKVGTRLQLIENSQEWTIRRLFVAVPDGTNLPPKSRVGTLLRIL